MSVHRPFLSHMQHNGVLLTFTAASSVQGSKLSIPTNSAIVYDWWTSKQGLGVGSGTLTLTLEENSDGHRLAQDIVIEEVGVDPQYDVQIGNGPGFGAGLPSAIYGSAATPTGQGGFVDIDGVIADTVIGRTVYFGVNWLV